MKTTDIISNWSRIAKNCCLSWLSTPANPTHLRPLWNTIWGHHSLNSDK